MKTVTTEFQDCAAKFVVNDKREEKNQATFVSNEAERDDLADRCSQSEKRIIEQKETLRAEMEEKQQKMHDKVDMIDRNITMKVDKTIRAVDVLKSDLFEALE